LPRQIEDEVAMTQLASAGIRIDQPTEDQIRAARTW
jgi:S-adenosylhomocysteine hydrolase